MFLLLFAAPDWLATGTCRWWGNLTPLWWGVGLSSACDEQVWDDSRSWAAAERWWSGREPEEGLHLQEETDVENKKEDKYSRAWHIKKERVCTVMWTKTFMLGLTWLWYWMSSHFWKWFGAEDVTLCLTLGDFRGSFKKRTNKTEIWKHSTFQHYFPGMPFKFYWNALPISVCLVIGGVTVAGLKAGPKRCFHK